MFSGKIALVTGAGSGIGRAVSQLLAKESAIVLCADRDKIAIERTLGSLKGSNHKAIEVDVADEESVSRMWCSLSDSIPQLVVNSAGITRDSFLQKMSLGDFQKVINVNLTGTFLVTQGICRKLIELGIGGSIVNLASIVGQTGNMGQCNYSASKAGVEAFTKTIAKEMGKFGIRCNAVVPGFIESPMTDAVPDKVKELFKSKISLGRLGKPDEVAEVILFLLSDKSSYVNGASVPVTGGF